MISIIIIVKNDQRINKLLNTLRDISYPQKAEIIVVDASAGKLDEIKNSHPQVRWLNFENIKKKNRTYAQQRNIGIRHAKGKYIVFIDADCIPEKNWLSELLDPIYKEQEHIVSGAVRPMDGNTHKEEQYGTYRDECETMNMAISREVIDAVGLFDEHMEGCEDSDFCIRARQKGYKIRHQPDAIVYHDWGGIKQNFKRSFNGGQDRASLYRKHPDLLMSPTINNIYTYYYLLYILGLPITVFFPHYVLILFIPSVIKRRDPIKEIYNLAFAWGLLIKAGRYILHL